MTTSNEPAGRERMNAVLVKGVGGLVPRVASPLQMVSRGDRVAGLGRSNLMEA